MRHLLFLLPILFFSCSNGPSPEELLSNIASLEGALKTNPNATSEEVNKLVESYVAYASHDKAEESKAVEYLLKAGDMSTRLKDFEKTLSYYQVILEEHPNSPKAAKALFMKGFTLDSRLGRLEEARAVYEEFLEKYPEDDFADDAAFSLKNLGKSAEDIIKEFESKKEGGESE